MAIISTITVTALAVMGATSGGDNIISIPHGFVDPLGYSLTNLESGSTQNTYSDEVDKLITETKYGQHSTVTVLTPGMGSSYRDWFVIDESAIHNDFIAYENIISTRYGLPFSIIDNSSKPNLNNIYKFYPSNGIVVLEKLFPLAQDDKYIFSKRYFEYVGETMVPGDYVSIDTSSDIVLLYANGIGDENDSSNTFRNGLATNSNDYHYSLFEESLNTILYDIAQKQYGYLPNINLIGHSRGGIINMMYANDRPEIVNNLISLGTPYVGSDWADLYVDLMKLINGPEYFTSYDDMLNENNITKYASKFNELNSEINSYAIGFQQTYLYLVNSVIKLVGGNENAIDEFAQKISDVFGNLITKDTIKNIINQILSYFTSTNGLTDILLIKLDNAEFATELISLILSDSESLDTFKDLLYKFENVLKKDLLVFEDVLGDGNIHSDICVNLNSQRGENRDYSPVYNFDRKQVITLGDSNNDNYFSELYCGRPEDPWVAHNFETKSPTAINDIINYLRSNNGLHTHDYSLHTTNSEHCIKCECGVEQHPYESHYYVTINNSDSLHENKCIFCQYRIFTPHIFEYTIVDNSTHVESCTDCEFSHEENHVFNQYSVGASTHTSYCECGNVGTTAMHSAVGALGRCVCGVQVRDPIVPIYPPIIRP